MNAFIAFIDALAVFILPFFVLDQLKSSKRPRIRLWWGWAVPLCYVLSFFIASTFVPGKPINMQDARGLPLPAMRANDMRLFPGEWAMHVWRPMMLLDHIVFYGPPFWTIGKRDGDGYKFEMTYKYSSWLD